MPFQHIVCHGDDGRELLAVGKYAVSGMSGDGTVQFRPITTHYPCIACFTNPDDLQITFCQTLKVYDDSNASFELFPFEY